MIKKENKKPKKYEPELPIKVFDWRLSIKNNNSGIERNSKNKELIPKLVNLIIKDQSFLVRGAAIWALQQLDNKNNLTSIKQRHLSFEKNNDVLAEWYI